MILHILFGTHAADPDANRWEEGRFVSACLICGRAMVKPAGGQWQLAATRTGR